mgnify:CR=1 FL=1
MVIDYAVSDGTKEVRAIPSIVTRERGSVHGLPVSDPLVLGCLGAQAGRRLGDGDGLAQNDGRLGGAPWHHRAIGKGPA